MQNRSLYFNQLWGKRVL